MVIVFAALKCGLSIEHDCRRPTFRRIDARGVKAEIPAMPITGAKVVKSVAEKFLEKYRAKDVKKHYSKFDAAVVVQVA